MKKLHLIAGLFAASFTAISAQADTLLLNAGAGSGWLAIAPPGSFPNNSYPSSSPINSVGGAWEAANVGWNSSASYNPTGWSAYNQTINSGWINGSGITPFYARMVFTLSGTPTAGTFTFGVDDDSQVWVNGTLIPGLNDANGGTNSPSTANIYSYLNSGTNVIAFKAHNSAGGGFSVFSLSGSATYTPSAVPDAASTMTLIGLALTGMIALQRRRSRS